MCSMGCSITSPICGSKSTTPTQPASPITSSLCATCSASAFAPRIRDSGRQTSVCSGQSGPMARSRRSYRRLDQHEAHRAAVRRGPAIGRLDPARNGNGIADPAEARSLSPPEQPCSGPPRNRQNRAHAVHAGVAARSSPQTARHGWDSTRAKPGTPCAEAVFFNRSRAKSATAPLRINAIERVDSTWWSLPSPFGTRSTSNAPPTSLGKIANSRSRPAPTCLPARLGAHQSHRRLHLAHQ